MLINSYFNLNVNSYTNYSDTSLISERDIYIDRLSSLKKRLSTIKPSKYSWIPNKLEMLTEYPIIEYYIALLLINTE